MITALYIEEAVAEHPLTRRIRARFSNIAHIPIERYGEVFNRKAQNFRLQKKHPALILARKLDPFVLPTPPGYGIGAAQNFYVSHMLNCVYDCRYCFLQGMYRSAHYVLFVNYRDFQQAMAAVLERAGRESCCFFTGYDCDSLALEPVSAYIADLLPFCARYPQAYFELRTKSTQVRTLLQQPALANVVIAFSLSPQSIAESLEHRAAPLQKRLQAMARLAAGGWTLGLRFDPLIYTPSYQSDYRQLFAAVFQYVPPERVHSVTLGAFRLPKPFFDNIKRLYPDQALFAASYQERNRMVSYPQDIAQSLRDFCLQELRYYVRESVIFPCAF